MSLVGTTNEEKIWNYLYNKIGNAYGTAGLMGNLQSESGLIPNRVEILCLKRLREHGKIYTDETYTAAVDSGAISRAEFLNPLPNKVYGYSLAQWTDTKRKSGLYDQAKQRGVSIGDLENALDYLWKELTETYINVLNILRTARSVKEASDVVLKKFECPADTGASVQNARAQNGLVFYNKYVTKEVDSVAIDYNKYINSTTSLISNSGHDENGKYSGGKAGDQTGSEWSLRSWYSRPWDLVLRHPDPKVQRLLAELGIEAALNDLVGYDQSQRDTYYAHLKASNWRPSQITIACEADCSAGIIANTKAVGHLLGITALQNVNATYTGNMRAGFKAAGFQVLTDSKYLTGPDYLLPGDVLLYERAHTAMNIAKGSKAGTTSTVTPTPKPSTNTQSTSSTLNETEKYKVTVNTASLNVRRWAGADHTLCSFSPVKSGTVLSVLDEVNAANGDKWLYIKYNGLTGFVCAKYTTGIKQANESKPLSKERFYYAKLLIDTKVYKNTDVNSGECSFSELKMKQIVNVCAELGDWLYIYKTINGQKLYGFIQKKNCVKTDYKQKTTTTLADKLVSEATRLANLMIEKKFVYSNSEVSPNYETAVKKGNLKVNCALFCSWALSSLSLIPSTATFYSNTAGKLVLKRMTLTDLEKHFTITYYEGVPFSKVKASKGSIIAWENQHMSLYTGKDEKGNHWIDFGKGGTKDKADGSQFDKSVFKTGNMDGFKVSAVIVPKD